MNSDETSPNGAPRGNDLPPVTPPSPAFILQLFLVPGILVAVVVAFIWLFFGWIGAGPRTPEQILAGLRSSNEVERWKTAEHFAQMLKRDPQLAGNVHLALDVAAVLRRELDRPSPSSKDEDAEESANAPDLAAEYLPPALASFNVPVGMPLFQEIIRNADPNEKNDRLRRRGAVWAVALLGERMKTYDTLASDRKKEMHAALQVESGGSNSEGREDWAASALRYLKYRDGSSKESSPDPFGVATTLALAARSDDEMTRKLTVLALAMWDEPGTEKVLRELCGGNEGLIHFEDADEERGRREIRYNAALALARRGSRLLPKGLLLEALDEQRQTALNPKQPGAVDLTLISALQAVAEMKKHDPAILEKDPEFLSAIERLTQSGNARVQVEAAKVLGGVAESPVAMPPFSREILLIIGIGGGVLLLLALAVIARWRRKPAAVE